MDLSWIKLLSDYGMAGIFILYLIYDRMVIMKSLEKTIKDNTTVMDRLIISVRDLYNIIRDRR